MAKISLDKLDRSKLTETPITLDGNPATITGLNLPYAKVVNPRTGQSVEFSWPTVERIVNSHRNFKS